MLLAEHRRGCSRFVQEFCDWQTKRSPKYSRGESCFAKASRVCLYAGFVQHRPNYNNFLNSSSVSPASRIIPLSVYGLILVVRGIVIFLVPFVIPICFLPKVFATQKSAFSKTVTARFEETS